MTKNITLALDNETRNKMEQFKDVKWSEVARQAILKKIRELEVMNNILKKSKLDKNSIDELSTFIETKVREERKTRL